MSKNKHVEALIERLSDIKEKAQSIYANAIDMIWSPKEDRVYLTINKLREGVAFKVTISKMKDFEYDEDIADIMFGGIECAMDKAVSESPIAGKVYKASERYEYKYDGEILDCMDIAYLIDA